ncbi:MAG: CopG family ribbon-helix-helix protein [Halodesulfurarchaeum sp.]
MPRLEVTLPDDVETELEQLSEEEFTSRDEAIEALLRAGIRTYAREIEGSGETDLSEEFAEDLWDTAGGPPGAGSEGEDEYSY